MMIARSIRHSVAQTMEEADFLIADVENSLGVWNVDQSNALHLLHESEGLVVGIILVKEHWNLCNLFVDPSAQRRGIGRALLDAVIPFASPVTTVAIPERHLPFVARNEQQKTEPRRDHDGRLEFAGFGKKTVEVEEIRQRLISLGIQVDWKRIDKLTREQNNIEHYYP
jgi:GNAT superfamily N-acetyltransferase